MIQTRHGFELTTRPKTEGLFSWDRQYVEAEWTQGADTARLSLHDGLKLQMTNLTADQMEELAESLYNLSKRMREA